MLLQLKCSHEATKGTRPCTPPLAFSQLRLTTPTASNSTFGGNSPISTSVPNPSPLYVAAVAGLLAERPVGLQDGCLHA